MNSATDKLESANAQLTSGAVTPEDWADLFHSGLYDGHLDAIELGAKRAGAKKWTKGGAPAKGYYSLDDYQDDEGNWHQGLKARARGMADEETQFLHGYTDHEGGEHRGWLNDLLEHDPRYWDDETGSWRPGSMDSRADLYVGKMRGSANQAFVDFSPEGSTFTWTLGASEHCPDCLEYATILVDRPADEFFAQPGMGDSVCLGNCECTVVRDDGVEGFGHHGGSGEGEK